MQDISHVRAIASTGHHHRGGPPLCGGAHSGAGGRREKARISRISPLAVGQRIFGLELFGFPSYGCGSKPMVPFWGRAPPILVNFSGDWDVHLG